MAQARDWDQERRERRARVHGRERTRVEADATEELEAMAAARASTEQDEFHALVEPARSLASEWRRLPREERESQRGRYIELVLECGCDCLAASSRCACDGLLAEAEAVVREAAGLARR